MICVTIDRGKPFLYIWCNTTIILAVFLKLVRLVGRTVLSRRTVSQHNLAGSRVVYMSFMPESGEVIQ